MAAYIDQRADDKQTEALGAIFTGAAGGPMAALAPLIGENLGVKKFRSHTESKARNVLRKSLASCTCLSIRCRPLIRAGKCGQYGPSGQSRKVGICRGAAGNTFSDHGMRWDNSGKNGHYAPIRWSNQS